MHHDGKKISICRFCECSYFALKSGTDKFCPLNVSAGIEFEKARVILGKIGSIDSILIPAGNISAIGYLNNRPADCIPPKFNFFLKCFLRINRRNAAEDKK